MRKTLLLLTTAAVLAGSGLTGSAIARDRIDRAELTANQIIDQFGANTARIKADLRLTPEQNKNWDGFASAMNDLGQANADRQVAMRAEDAQPPKVPIDVIEQMRRQAKFMAERSVERKKLADAAQPLYASLDEQQKQRFGQELLGLSRWPDTN
jgi:LTXXQ motif family protein